MEKQLDNPESECFSQVPWLFFKIHLKVAVPENRWYKTAPGTWWTSRNLSLRHFWPMPLQQHLGLLSKVVKGQSESQLIAYEQRSAIFTSTNRNWAMENLGHPTPFGLNMAQFLCLKPVNQNGSEEWIAGRMTAVPHWSYIQLYGKTLSRYIENKIVR